MQPVEDDDLPALYEACKTLHNWRQGVAQAARVLSKAGIAYEGLPRDYRDKRGNYRSAELDFVLMADAAGATNKQIVMTLWPNTTESTMDSALDNVRQMKATLRKTRV